MNHMCFEHEPPVEAQSRVHTNELEHEYMIDVMFTQNVAIECDMHVLGIAPLIVDEQLVACSRGAHSQVCRGSMRRRSDEISRRD